MPPACFSDRNPIADSSPERDGLDEMGGCKRRALAEMRDHRRHRFSIRLTADRRIVTMRIRVALTLAVILALALATGPVASQTVGVTAGEIKVGNTNPYSGPASAYGTIGKAIGAYFKKVNDEGGINGRKINYITYDDSYSPPKTVEMVRKLVEQDRVALLFQTLGTRPTAPSTST